MPDSYSEREVADLLRRAARLQSRGEGRGPGLSLDEIKHAAEVAGIDPLYVEQAAHGAGDDLPPSEPFLGMQTGARRVRVVPGEVSDDEWGKMVATLRRQLGGTGTVETIGGVREWRRDPYQILLEPEGENTRITATANWRADAMGAFTLTSMFLLFALVMVAASYMKGKPDVLVLAGLFAAMGAGSALFTWPRLYPKGARIEAKIDRALDALQAVAGSEERAEALASAPEVSRIDPALLDGPARLGPEAEAPERRRERS